MGGVINALLVETVRAIPLFMLGGLAFVLLSRSTLGRALIRRGSEALDSSRIDQLIQELEGLKRELVDVQERLDFTERLIASKEGDQKSLGR